MNVLRSCSDLSVSLAKLDDGQLTWVALSFKIRYLLTQSANGARQIAAGAARFSGKRTEWKCMFTFGLMRLHAMPLMNDTFRNG